MEGGVQPQVRGLFHVGRKGWETVGGGEVGGRKSQVGNTDPKADKELEELERLLERKIEKREEKKEKEKEKKKEKASAQVGDHTRPEYSS